MRCSLGPVLAVVVGVLLLCATPSSAQEPSPTVQPIPSIDPEHFQRRSDGPFFPPPPLVVPEPVLDPAAPPMLSTFEGYSFDDNGTYLGVLGIPPDPIGVAGPGHLVAVGNYLIEWRDRNGANLNRQSLQSLFGSVTTTFDPKVIFDQHAQRFVVVALERDFVLYDSRIHVAVTVDADPNNGWYTYVINSKLNFFNTTLAANADHWADYPGLAVDDDAVYVTNNMFTFQGLVGSTYFGDSRLWILRKGLGSGGLYDGGPMAWTVHDPSPASSGGPSELFTMQPCHVFGPNPHLDSIFLVSGGWSTDFGLGSGAGDEFLSVTLVDTPLSAPVFTHQFLSVGNLEDARVAMPDAPQATCAPVSGTEILPANPPVETNDRRALHCVWRNGELWATAQVVPEFGADAGQATAHWWRLDTSVPGAVAVLDQGDVGAEDLGPQTHTFFPSIAVNGAGDMAIGFAASNDGIYPGAYYTGRRAIDPPAQVDPTSLLAAGVDCYNRTFCAGRNRWGDYSGSSVDPNDDNTFWIFNEYAIARGTPTSCAGGDEYGRWGTRWGSFNFGSPDLVVSLWQAPCCLADGDDIGPQVQMRVRNVGTVGTTVPVRVGVYLSPDPPIDPTDLLLPGAIANVPPLAPGAEVAVALPPSIPIPPAVFSGPVFVGALVDDTFLVAEADETNNAESSDAFLHPDPWGCARVFAESNTGLVVSVTNVPDGTGRPLSAAQWWDGVPGSAPTVVDATVRASITDEVPAPVPGLLLTLVSTAGGLAVCPGHPAADGPSDPAGQVTMSGALFAGGHTDLPNGERVQVVEALGSPFTEVIYGPTRMLASDQIADLYAVDLLSGAATLQCNVPLAGLTAIDHEPQLGLSYGQEPDGNFVGALIDPAACVPLLGPYPTPQAFTGVEWIRGLLFGAGILNSCGPSTLFTIDPFGPGFHPIGPLGPSPVSGLAYDPLCERLYGVTGCTTQFGPSLLLQIDPNTGTSIVIGSTGVELGGLEMGPDGHLYAGGNTRDGARLHRIDRRTGVATPVGPTGMPQGVTGLTLESAAGLRLMFNSPDINGDLVVDLADVGSFASIFSSGVYDYAVDYRYDGLVDLADIGDFARHLGAICPSFPKQAVEVARDAGSLRFVPVGTPGSGAERAEPGDALAFDLVAEGRLALRGLRAWEGALEHSANVEIESFTLCEGSLDLGGDTAHHVGLAAAIRSETGVVRLGRLRLHLRDDAPAVVRLVAPTPSSVQGVGPAVLIGGGSGEDEEEQILALADAVLTFNGATIDEPVSVVRGLGLRNVPNPFNPRTEIRFELPHAGRVEVEIYDLGGRLVRRLDPGRIEAGATSLSWDGTDRNGRGLASGLYLYRLRLDGQPLGTPRKMALLR